MNLVVTPLHTQLTHYSRNVSVTRHPTCDMHVREMLSTSMASQLYTAPRSVLTTSPIPHTSNVKGGQK